MLDVLVTLLDKEVVLELGRCDGSEVESIGVTDDDADVEEAKELVGCWTKCE